MTENNDPRTSQQPTATVQSSLIGHLIQPGPEHKRLDVFIGQVDERGSDDRRSERTSRQDPDQ